VTPIISPDSVSQGVNSTVSYRSLELLL